jgi:hypothetical protein
MFGFTLFLHFCGLMLGAAGSFAGGLVMLRARSAPADQAETLRALGWPLAMMGATGLVILWATGILMIFFTAPSLPSLFWAKILFVVVLTVLSGLIHKTYADIRRTGDMGLVQRLFVLGPASGATLLLIVLLAVYAFA